MFVKLLDKSWSYNSIKNGAFSSVYSSVIDLFKIFKALTAFTKVDSIWREVTVMVPDRADRADLTDLERLGGSLRKVDGFND